MKTSINSPETSKKQTRGWEIARKNFGNKIYFYAPSIKRYETSEFKNSTTPFFAPISITGNSCKLQCDHCKTKILETMIHVKTPQELLNTAEVFHKKGTKGLLISGGSNRDGSVPLIEYISAIEEIKKKYRLQILVHTGLVDQELAHRLGTAEIDAAMIDIIGSDETIKQVCHLDSSVADYENSLKLLTKHGIKTAPHVVIGLHYGEIRGEHNALKIISKYDPSSLVLVVLMPQHDTPMHKVAPPQPNEINKIFHEARKMFPKTPILLGCARPPGEHKIQTDALALKAGINGIAYPSEGIIGLAKELELEPVFSESCCSLVFQDLQK